MMKNLFSEMVVEGRVFKSPFLEEFLLNEFERR